MYVINAKQGMSLGFRTQSSRVRTQKPISCMLMLYVDPKATVITQSTLLLCPLDNVEESYIEKH